MYSREFSVQLSPPLLAAVQTSSSFTPNSWNILCVCPCSQSYREYTVYMKQLFCQYVLGFFILFISSPRLRCQTSTKHLFKPAALHHCWGSASCGPCCHSADVESLFEARNPLVKVEILVSLSFCSIEYLKHAHAQCEPNVLFVVNNNGKSQRGEYQLPGSI